MAYTTPDPDNDYTHEPIDYPEQFRDHVFGAGSDDYELETECLYCGEHRSAHTWKPLHAWAEEHAKECTIADYSGGEP